jgi:hypothetical protein
MLALLIALLLCTQVSAFCYMNEVDGIQKYMMLHNKPTTFILVNHYINKYSKRTGVSASKIKSCIQNEKAKQKPNLRGLRPLKN